MHGPTGHANFAGGRANVGGNRFANHTIEGNRGGRNAIEGNRGGRNAAMRANAIHNTLGSRSFARAMHNPGALRNPGTRAALAASAATAGWHNMHGGGWWRHGNGGYGWVGPLFWPFAYYDIYDYSLWGYDPSFWGYGYGDIYAGLFAPYGYDDLAGYLPPGGYYGGGYGSGYSSRSGRATSAAGAENAAPQELSEMCGEDSGDIAGLPIDRIQQAIQPNETQRAALDDLANASVKAAQTIRAACPSKIVSTAPGRLAAMETRLEAMITAVGIVQPPLDHFWSLLDDEQKTRLSALGEDLRNERRGNRNAGAAADQACSEASAPEWPAAEIDQRLHPTPAQRASLANLNDATAKAAELLKTTCAPDTALTPPTRLAAAGKRLDTMLQAVKMVKAAVDDLYNDLTDEQKAQFEAIGPGRTSALSSDESPSTSGRHYHRRHHASLGGIVRRLISFGF